MPSLNRWVIVAIVLATLSTALTSLQPLKARWPEVVSSAVGAVAGTVLAVWLVRKMGRKVEDLKKKIKKR
ncbi:MAG: hypothetical protein QXJ97_13710 [Desulfurococcaceae archaeon]